MTFEPIVSPSMQGAAELLANLGTTLIDSGAIDRRTLDRARRVATETGARLDQVLTQLGLMSDRGLAEALAQLIAAPVVGPADYPDTPLFHDRLKAKFLRRARVLPIDASDDRATLAMADPLDGFTRDAVAAALGRPVSVAVAVPIELEAAFDRLYAELSEGGDNEDMLDEVVPDAEPAEEDAERLKDLASEAPVIRLVNQLIARAVETHASDVHVEPFPDRLRIRYRYDGVLHEVEPPPARLQAAIISRIKIMARLDIAERRLPQDGRIKLTVRGHEIDFRVSTIPSLHGEKVVLRVLDRTAVEFDYEKLGLPPDIRQGIERALELPNGMVLVTGPTGSGKTTTLYAALMEIRNDEDKILTIEDPVEYQIRGITQIPVNEKKGLTFARGLRSILRHDPDKIMVGEIRDVETAQIAIQSALTGHLVFTTVHANNVVDVLGRFLNMGVDPYNFVSALNCILAQRLVRMICSSCRKPVRQPEQALIESGLKVEQYRDFAFYEGVGCLECNGTGYRGRTAIHELLDLSDRIREMIIEKRPTSEIKRVAHEEGMAFLRESALAKVFAGITTLKEINKVTFIG